MPNNFYTPTGNPTDNSLVVSSDMRAEFAAINAGFNKLPTLTGNANKLVVINSSGTGMDVTLAPSGLTSVNKVAITQPANGATFTLLDGKTLTVNHSITLAGTDSTTMTFPATSASVARIDAAQTFTGIQDFDGRIDANAGLTVAGAAFTSRGITDSATATALTLSGSGANSVTIANSAGNPVIGTTAQNLVLGTVANSAVIVGSSGNGNYLFLSAMDGVSDGGEIQFAGAGAYGTAAIDNREGDIRVVTAGGVQAVINNTASADRYITLTGSAGGNPTIGTSGGNLALSSSAICAGDLQARAATAAPAGGMAAIYMGTNGYSIGFGSGAPTYVAAKGSLYLRSDGSSTSTRVYVATDSAGAWTYLTTGA